MTMEIFALRKQWRMTKVRFQSTWFWRVFGVRAMQKWWTKFLVAVAIMAGFWSLFSYVQSLNPALPLERLTKNEGVLVHVYQPLRTAHGSTIRILADSGEEIAYRGSIFDITLLIAAKGKRVTVWSQQFYDLWWPFYYERVWQIQEGAQVLMSYESVYQSRQSNKSSHIWLAKRLLILAILSLAIVALACHKGVSAE
ncbi:hypothetical protein ACEUBB_12575 [Aeromonas rivipollensis]|uniref:Uncharacterized protein n=1 Tax=Aeromonas rivipollensis TaxID=948519 RepID=A0ABX0D288_9GAMM|nr:hypothetical protein [Aeromonas rivipollensis]NEX90193.1 hypothetical protein [Aeromonas rivipollensis]NEY06214.1 hypothetical protein [Aeromonas rivipollensis]